MAATLLRNRCLAASRQNALHPMSIRAFQTAAVQRAQRSEVLPQDGTFIKGTVNDPTTFPEPNKAHGSYHWTFERLLSAALIPVVGATFVTSPNPVLDGVLATTIILHSHLGFDQILLDYVHKRKFPALAPIANWAVRLATVLALVGVYKFNTQDVGITELIKRLWKAEKKEAAPLTQ